ncbi:ABC transporter ATP-binding protein [Cellulomonas phragmiteti]|uniref:ABC transporter ATP-binding protein n=1 Tax=Cellulomonas phragmiteti TaxID=478780 RepID=A0ABQ4DLL9_9CELL|nr:ABC transporter ATP-binding protein [Cellulomonas phragmiteti]GIG40240.1 ABC transporter ATP-binding protein [Cellulomonas phragmiteti]
MTTTLAPAPSGAGTGTTSEPQLVVEHVHRRFPSPEGGTVDALVDADLTVRPGEFISLIGPSGCGKSTLFNLIAGLDTPTEGRILIDGVDRSGQQGLVGYMLQKDLLLPWRTVLENVVLGLEIGGVRRKAAQAIARPLLSTYGLGGFEGRYPAQLSGGMRQRVALLRTILFNRDVILLDEPFGALDAQTREQMQEWLLDLWDDFQKTVLFVTHDIDEAIYLSDRVVVMSARPGRIVASFDVPLDRPRKPSVVTSAEFVRLKADARELLNGAHRTHDVQETR